jgi:hypothetical protein
VSDVSLRLRARGDLASNISCCLLRCVEEHSLFELNHLINCQRRNPEATNKTVSCERSQETHSPP